MINSEITILEKRLKTSIIFIIISFLLLSIPQFGEVLAIIALAGIGMFYGATVRRIKMIKKINK